MDRNLNSKGHTQDTNHKQGFLMGMLKQETWGDEGWQGEK